MNISTENFYSTEHYLFYILQTSYHNIECICVQLAKHMLAMLNNLLYNNKLRSLISDYWMTLVVHTKI